MGCGLEFFHYRPLLRKLVSLVSGALYRRIPITASNLDVELSLIVCHKGYWRWIRNFDPQSSSVMRVAPIMLSTHLNGAGELISCLLLLGEWERWSGGETGKYPTCGKGIGKAGAHIRQVRISFSTFAPIR
ncbi:hypothetical protein TNCV_1617131 [Trichonephila clavipes]|nr:hypothetical protein TNCV_1617131 [Trichonephila clavipes]